MSFDEANALLAAAGFPEPAAEFPVAAPREMRRPHIRELDLDFASFAVLPPLPGTDLFDEFEDRLLIRDTDFFDFIHTVLPTRLPLEEFFDELMGLYRRAVPPSRQLSLLRKFPMSEWPGLCGRSYRTFKRMRTTAEDYAGVV